jgi:hypothetical protein
MPARIKHSLSAKCFKTSLFGDRSECLQKYIEIFTTLSSKGSASVRKRNNIKNTRDRRRLKPLSFTNKKQVACMPAAVNKSLMLPQVDQHLLAKHKTH